MAKRAGRRITGRRIVAMRVPRAPPAAAAASAADIHILYILFPETHTGEHFGLLECGQKADLEGFATTPLLKYSPISNARQKDEIHKHAETNNISPAWRVSAKFKLRPM